MNFEHPDTQGPENTIEKKIVTERRIFEVVQEVLSKVLRINDPSVVKLKSTTVKDLRVEPLDLLQINFGICNRLDISIPFGSMIKDIASDTSLTVSSIVEYLKGHEEIILVEEEDI